jgi:hypothetical protein
MPAFAFGGWQLAQNHREGMVIAAAEPASPDGWMSSQVGVRPGQAAVIISATHRSPDQCLSIWSAQPLLFGLDDQVGRNKSWFEHLSEHRRPSSRTRKNPSGATLRRQRRRPGWSLVSSKLLQRPASHLSHLKIATRAYSIHGPWGHA